MLSQLVELHPPALQEDHVEAHLMVIGRLDLLLAAGDRRGGQGQQGKDSGDAQAGEIDQIHGQSLHRHQSMRESPYPTGAMAQAGL